MRRMTITALVLFGMLVCSGAQQRAIAEEAAPDVVMPVLTGTLGYMTYANFGALDPTTLTAAPMGLTIFQLELAPGASVIYPQGDPGVGAHLVESGTLTLREFSVDIMVTRAATHSGHAPVPAVMLPAGSEMQVGAGDGFLFPPMAAGEFRNDGTEPVVLAISVLSPMGEQAASGAAPMS